MSEPRSPLVDAINSPEFRNKMRAVNEKIGKMFRDMAEGLRRAHEKRTPIQRDALNVAYVRVLANRERAKAKAHLSAEALRVRTELGLPTHVFDRGPFDEAGQNCWYVGTWDGGNVICTSPEGAHPE